MGHYSISVSWFRFLVSAGVVLTLTFAMLMPGISDSLESSGLLLFWAAHVFGALVILQSVQTLLSRLPVVSSHSPWLQVFVSGLIGAVLFTPIAGFLDYLFGIAEVTDDQSESLFELLVSEFTGLVSILTIVWLGLNASRLVQIQTTRQRDDAPASNPVPAFWDRVPKDVGRDLVALSAELHYISIYTTESKVLTLFPFGQAVELLLGSVKGMQIHRSHWVALSHIENLRRNGQGGICQMKTGLELPVSRRYMKKLENSLASECWASHSCKTEFIRASALSNSKPRRKFRVTIK